MLETLNEKTNKKIFSKKFQISFEFFKIFFQFSQPNYFFFHKTNVWWVYLQLNGGNKR